MHYGFDQIRILDLYCITNDRLRARASQRSSRDQTLFEQVVSMQIKTFRCKNQSLLRFGVAKTASVLRLCQDS